MVPIEETIRRVTKIIAATRFPFIDQEDWDMTWQVYTNDYLDKQFIIDIHENERYTPSLVSTFGNGDLRVICEVETDDTINKGQVPRWKKLSELAGVTYKLKKFFLYVPENMEVITKKLLDDNEIEYAGLRTWAIKDGNLMITPISTPDEEKDHR